MDVCQCVSVSWIHFESSLTKLPLGLIKLYCIVCTHIVFYCLVLLASPCALVLTMQHHAGVTKIKWHFLHSPGEQLYVAAFCQTDTDLSRLNPRKNKCNLCGKPVRGTGTTPCSLCIHEPFTFLCIKPQCALRTNTESRGTSVATMLICATICTTVLHNLFYCTRSKPLSLFPHNRSLSKCVYLVYCSLSLPPSRSLAPPPPLFPSPSLRVSGVRAAPVCFLVVSGSPGLWGTRIIFPL